MNKNELTEKMLQLYFSSSGELNSFPWTLTNVGEEKVLLYLYREKTNVLVGELTVDLHLSTGRIANLLKQLERKDLIVRIQQTEDRRRFEVSLTEKGEAYAKELYEMIWEVQQKFLKKMGKKDAEELLRLLEKTVTIIQSLD